MKLLFLGAGSAFTIGDGNYQSNIILESDSGKKLLIDCGSDIRFSLNEQQLSYADISDIYISHMHADHIGGLEYFGYSHKFDPRCSTPKIYISEYFRDMLWQFLLGGMRSLNDRVAGIDDFFVIEHIKKDGFFCWENIQFKLIDTVHMTNGFYPEPSFGLFFDVNGKRVFITTDTQYTPDLLMPYYDEADLIFHDCETAPTKSTVHSHYQDLCQLPQEIKQKMWLYHYQPGTLPNATADGFLGFVTKGQKFEL